MTWVLGFIIFVLVLWLGISYTAHQIRVRDLMQELLVETIRADTAREVALADAALILKRKEKEMRQDAVKRSQSVTKGKVAEQIAPFLPGFKYDPRDCRFLGSPVDFVVFDGMTAGRLNQVVFVEIKCGKYARLTQREREVKDILEMKGAQYELIKTSQD